MKEAFPDKMKSARIPALGHGSLQHPAAEAQLESKSQIQTRSDSPPPSAQQQRGWGDGYGDEDMSTLRARKRRRIVETGRQSSSDWRNGSARSSPDPSSLLPSSAQQQPASSNVNTQSPAASQQGHRRPLPRVRQTRPSLMNKCNLPEPRARPFDGYNSTSTGHQVADGNRLAGSTSWRLSRTYKLEHQFRGLEGRVADLVGAGASEAHEDGGSRNSREQETRLAEKAARVDGKDIRGFFSGGGPGQEKSKNEAGFESRMNSGNDIKARIDTGAQARHSNKHIVTTSTITNAPKLPSVEVHQGKSSQSQIFKGLNIYINGSTMPLIGDHKLKQLLATHGANMSIGLARRTVTHVIVGKQVGGSELGVGGGLAAGKMQKEIATMRGKGVKFVSVEW